MRNKNVNSVVLSLGINSHHDFDFNFNLMVFLTLGDFFEGGMGFFYGVCFWNCGQLGGFNGMFSYRI